MEQNEHGLPLGLCRQAMMKFDSAITDIHEIMEGYDISQEDRESFETIVDIVMTVQAHLLNMATRECGEEEFLIEDFDMDDIDPYPEMIDQTDMLDEEV